MESHRLTRMGKRVSSETNANANAAIATDRQVDPNSRSGLEYGAIEAFSAFVVGDS